MTKPAQHKTVRGRPQADGLPGLPDATPSVPPKARAYAGLSLDEAITRSYALLDEVRAGFDVPRLDANGGPLKGKDDKVRMRHIRPPDQVFCLFSGGGDSSILAHLLRDRVDGFIHIDTGINISATGRYVRAVSEAWGVPLHIARPDDAYRDLVLGNVKAKTKDRAVWKGFPGPAGHHVMYVRLKERALDKFRRDAVGPRGRSGQIAFLAGMRWGESDRRFRNAAELDPWGAVTWVSPIVYWTDGHVAEYRSRHMCHANHEHAPHRLCHPCALPLSEVTVNLHMSGDCLCGAYAKPGELDMIRLFYPADAAPIEDLQDEAKACGLKRWLWGAGKQSDDGPAPDPGRLCSKCVPEIDGQDDLFAQWREAGLITDGQYAGLAGLPEVA